MSVCVSLCLLVVFSVLLVGALRFEDFGAIEGSDAWEVAVNNSLALQRAAHAANASDSDKVVTFDSEKVYYLRDTPLSDLTGVTFSINATLKFSDDVKKYNFTGGSGNTSLLLFTNAHSVVLEGDGTVDGSGLEWWRLCYKGEDNRPNLVEFVSSVDILVRGLLLLDSPRFTLYLKDCRDAVIHDLTIYVNSSIERIHGNTSVMYPLNTDGIDIAAENVTVYNVNITNYDDAIVVKPCRHTFTRCRCAGDVVAYNNTIRYSTGLAIGSVPPHRDHNCVRNVTFRDSELHYSLKAIYVKTNPGDRGTGEISHVRYENIRISHALWWTVWIGPQQQNQPGTDNQPTGCNFLFPYVPRCPTQPRVTVRLITLQNITATDTLPLFQSPGVVLCNHSNPCSDFLFANVVNTPYSGDTASFLQALPASLTPLLPWLDEQLQQLGQGRDERHPIASGRDWAFDYITAYVYGREVGRVQPDVCLQESCFWKG